MDPLTIALGIGAYQLIIHALSEDRKDNRVQSLTKRTNADLRAMQDVTDQTRERMRDVAAHHRQQFTQRVKR